MCGQVGYLKKDWQKVNGASSVSSSKLVYEDIDASSAESLSSLWETMVRYNK